MKTISAHSIPLPSVEVHKGENQEGAFNIYTAVYCQGCEMWHPLFERCIYKGLLQVWTITEDNGAITASPSYLFKTEDGNEKRCHYFIRDGHFHYCNDCDHDKRGEIVKAKFSKEVYSDYMDYIGKRR